MSLSYRSTKRLLDVVAAVFFLVLTVPLQLVLAALVAWRLGRPVFFVQARLGLHGKPFLIRKFRTLLPADPERGLVDDGDRLTPLGRVLRHSSLDELPSLWNVLRGDMSLVGPRPLLLEYTEHYTAEEAGRHEVRPGLTGLAVIRGRNAISWDEKLAADLEYVRRCGWLLDLRILARTLLLVVSGRGVSAPGSATMPSLSEERRR